MFGHNYTSYFLKHKGSTLIYHLSGLVACVAWGASFIATKNLINDGLNPVEIYVYRFLIAYICTLLICPTPLWSHSFKDEMMFLLCGVCGGSVFFISENTSVQYTLVSNVSLITTTSPLITVMIVAALYKSQRPTGGFIFGSIMAFLGVACVIFNSSFQAQVNPLGDMLAVVSAVVWAVYCVLLRPLGSVYSSWFISRKVFFYGIITALPFLAVEPHLTPIKEIVTNTSMLLNFGFLGLVCSMLAYVLWALCISRLGSVKSGNYLYISPIVTLVLSAWLLNEPITLIGVIGCVMILGGVILSEKLGRKRGLAA